MGIITISRQLGAGATTIAPEVARRLGWECIDKQILEREVEETGIALPYLVHYDERDPKRLTTRRVPDEPERYFQALKRIIESYADRGDVVIVGRGANFILRGRDALHYRLIADMPFRIRRVMEIRWVNDGPARDVIAESDRDRAAFIRHYFNEDVNNPEHYHAVINTSMMGIETIIERIVWAARDRWGLAADTGDGPDAGQQAKRDGG